MDIFLAMLHASSPAASFEFKPYSENYYQKGNVYELMSQGKLIDKYTIIENRRSYTILYREEIFLCEITYISQSPTHLVCWIRD